ncbi:MAG: hypothetical protein ACI31S_01460 [Bacilli bacterium]
MKNKYNLINDDPIRKLFSSDELRRLEKAAKDKNRFKIVEWAEQFEDQLRREYDNAFKQEVEDAIENFCVAIAYTLHFSEDTKFGPEKLNSFMDDLFITIDMFRIGEYNPEEYKEKLKNDGIHIFDE